MKYLVFCLILIGFFCVAETVYAALQNDANIAATSVKSETTDSVPALGAVDSGQQTGVVKVVRIVGASAFKETELRTLFDEYSGKKVTSAEMKKAAERITAYYAERGYNVLASMLSQDISEGVVLYYLVEEKKSPAKLAALDRTAWQKLITRDMQSNPLTRAFYTRFSHGANLLVKPTLTISEEFNDNIFVTESKQRQYELITSISPGINLQYSAKRWNWSFDYNPTYRTFLHASSGDQLVHSLSLDGKTTIVRNLLYLDITDSYSRTSIDPNRDNRFSNQAYMNRFSVTPYFNYSLDGRWMANGGYAYSSISTPGPAVTDIQTNMIFLSMSRQLTDKAGLGVGVNASKVKSGTDERFSRLTYYGGISYSYSVNSSVQAKGGYTLTKSQAGESSTSPYWHVSLAHSWRTYTLNVTSGILYDNQIGSGGTENMFIKASLARSFHRGVVTMPFQFSQVTDIRQHTTSGQWYGTGVDGTYELTARAKAAASIMTDKYVHDRIYRNICTVRINYQLFYDMSVDAAYSRLAHSNTIFVPVGTIAVNQFTFSLFKSF